jgi:hypothetical protein
MANVEAKTSSKIHLTSYLWYRGLPAIVRWKLVQLVLQEQIWMEDAKWESRL